MIAISIVKTNNVKKLLVLIAALFYFLPVCGQTYEQAISLLIENKRADAITALRELQKSDKTQASLALSVIEADEEHYYQAFKDFKIFFQNHPNPYPYLYALYNSGIFNKGEYSNNNEEVDEFFQQILDDHRANCTIKSCAIDFLGANKIMQGDFKAARNIYANLNDVKNWGTAGEFENVSGSGFNKDFGPLAHPGAESEFVNKTGAKVKWFDIPEVKNDRWWDLEYSHNISNAVIYTQTFVHSDADREVLLMVGVSGSVKIWLNDFQVGAESEERNTDEDVYCYRVRLQKGVNRLLLQTGSSEIDRNNFMVRFADINGNLVTDINSSAHFEPYTKAQPYEVRQMPFFAEKYFEQEVASHPGDFIDQLLLLAVYNHNEKKYEAHKALASLKKIAPASSLVAEKIIETANIDNNVIDATKEKEFIKTNDPESLRGLYLRYNDAVSKENWDEAMVLLDKRNSMFGETPFAEAELISILSKKKEIEKLNSEVDAAYQKYPYYESIVQYKYALTYSATRDIKKSNAILNSYLKNYYSERIEDILINNYLKTGKKNEAIDLYKKQIENNPVSREKYLELAMMYYGLRDYNGALEWIGNALNLYPYNSRFFYTAGLIYQGRGEKDNAIEMMKKAVYYSPTNYEAREKLRTLEDKKKLLDYFKQNDVVKIYNDALKNEKYAKEEGVILVKDKREIVYPERGASEEQEELLVYINSQSAINRYKEYYIYHNGFKQKLIVEKAELLKKDGNKVPAERRQGYLVFSSMAIGDAVHIYYKLENSYDGELAEHFWNEMYFNSDFPVQTARFSLIVSKDKKFDFKQSNKDLKHDETAIDDYKMYVWEENDIPKIAPEPMSTTAIYDKLTVSSIPDWNYVANWYSDVSNVKTKAEFEVKGVVKDLMAGNENKTNVEKARIIYDYIEKNYNYSNVSFLHSAFTPQSASRTMSTKLGDCKDLSTLFVSMAREAGLDANLILVRTKGSGDDDLELPAIAFNHCIAQLHVDNKNYIIELTNNHLPFASMGIGILNANGLYIPKDGGYVTDAQLIKLNTTDRPINANIRESAISLAGDQAVIHRLVYKIGAESAVSRSAFKDIDEEEKLKKLTTAITSEFNKNVKVEHFKIENLMNLSDTLILSYDITVDNFSSEMVGMTVFRIPWIDAGLREQLFSLDKRKYPMDLRNYTSTPVSKETITIEIPAGEKLAEVPKDVTINNAALTYSLKFDIKEDKVTATREVHYLKDKILPGEYEEMKSMISQITKADTKEIALK